MLSVVAVALLGACGATALAQELEIRPAVELIFPAAAGKAYQLRSSTDLLHWQGFEEPILGEAGTIHRWAPAGEGTEFFQLVVNDVRDLSGQLETIRANNNVPAVACAVILSNRLVGLGFTGVRKFGVSNAPVTLRDKWHHGSLTKSMTATLAALMVERGQIRWETTLGELFPDFAPQMNAAWRTVTLEWLCSNRAGAPENLSPSGIWGRLQGLTGTPREGRRFLLENLTVLAPSSTPGTKYEYSNAGFSLAGHMLETAANRAWEELLTEQLFEPLGMTSAGFGVPATPRHIDQPWGHQVANGRPSPIEPGPGADNPPAIGPSATVHCNLLDMARYVAFHLASHQEGSAILGRDATVKLHTAVPNNANYAYGWNAVDRPWANGKALNHAGSNTQWYSVIWMAPNREFGVVALCNLATASGANPGAAATDQTAAYAIQQFLSN
jgi:CubicO group peptidase (beta-lactamase class C family)